MSNNEFISGGFGGFVGVGLSHPFDTIRVRMQTNPKEFTSIKNCISKSYTQGGIRSFYKGFIPPLFGIGLEKSIVFGFYNSIYNRKIFNNKYYNTFISGLGAGFVCTSIVTPLERIKINLQYLKNGGTKYNNSVEAVSHIIK